MKQENNKKSSNSLSENSINEHIEITELANYDFKFPRTPDETLQEGPDDCEIEYYEQKRRNSIKKVSDYLNDERNIFIDKNVVKETNKNDSKSQESYSNIKLEYVFLIDQKQKNYIKSNIRPSSVVEKPQEVKNDERKKCQIM